MRDVRMRILLGGLLVLCLATAGGVAFAARCGGTTCPKPSENKTCPEAKPTCPAPCQNIVDVLCADGRFTKLVAAIDSAGLTETLNGEGPFIVFAPTDKAFGKLDICPYNELVADKAKLTNFLLYHVAPGRLMSCDLKKLKTLGTLQGAGVAIKSKNGNVYVNDVKVVKDNVKACNGVIYYIDTVLTPPTCVPDTNLCGVCAEDAVSTLMADARFSTFVDLINTAGLSEFLKVTSPITIFAPTNDALGCLPAGALDALKANPCGLRQLILYHVAPGKMMAADLRKMDPFNSFLGDPLTPACAGNSVMINNTNISIIDIKAGNGVIQAIDGVLMPPQ